MNNYREVKINHLANLIDVFCPDSDRTMFWVTEYAVHLLAPALEKAYPSYGKYNNDDIVDALIILNSTGRKCWK